MKPTVGRIVIYKGGATPDGEVVELAAIVVKVHSDTRVNLAIFDPDGSGTFGRTSCLLGEHWRWPVIAPPAPAGTAFIPAVAPAMPATETP